MRTSGGGPGVLVGQWCKGVLGIGDEGVGGLGVGGVECN